MSRGISLLHDQWPLNVGYISDPFPEVSFLACMCLSLFIKSERPAKSWSGCFVLWQEVLQHLPHLQL